MIYPSWKTPFANTFGYMATKMGGLNQLFNDKFLNTDDILKKNEGSRHDNLQVSKAIQHIYGNETLLI